jgi:hypothetical protein
VTHCFHPLFGREFELVNYRNNWGVYRVYYYDETGLLASLEASWTDWEGADRFVELAGGQAIARVEDLLRLVGLLGEIRTRKCKANDAVNVKEIMSDGE